MILHLKEKQKLTQITAKKYQRAKKKNKTTILDTFTGQNGYVRKYAVHILASEGNALKNKAFRRVCQDLNDACSMLPLPVRILHSDNGGEFINNVLRRALELISKIV